MSMDDMLWKPKLILTQTDKWRGKVIHCQ